MTVPSSGHTDSRALPVGTCNAESCYPATFRAHHVLRPFAKSSLFYTSAKHRRASPFIPASSRPVAWPYRAYLFD